MAIRIQYIRIWISTFYLLNSFTLYAQEYKQKTAVSPIHTAVPCLTITPDARGGGMGDTKAANEPDVYAQYRNPAKYPFTYYSSAIGISYTPWLRKWINDIALLYVAGYKRLNNHTAQTIGASLRYFTLGEVSGMKDETGGSLPSFYPYEMAADISYSQKLSSSFSMAVALRYIRSDLGVNLSHGNQSAHAFSVDIAGYGEHYFIWNRSESLWSFGFHISDIGTRISYDKGKNHFFLPTLLTLGTGILYPLNSANHLGVYFDIHKYLVPSLPVYAGNTPEEKEAYDKTMEKYNSMTSLKGIFRSFSDAPGGWREELQEIICSAGIEYRYDNFLFFRTGYYHENRNKGNRQYVTLGTGLRIKGFQLDISWLISTIRDNPLDQTVRLSLSCDIGAIKNLVY